MGIVIEVDVEQLELGDSLHLSDITIPSGVEVASLAHGGDEAQSVVSVHVPRVIAEPEDVAAEATEDDEAIEGGEDDAASAETDD